MIQRIQTIYLLLVIICILLMYVMPVAQIKIVDDIFDFRVSGLEYPVNGEMKNLIKIPFGFLIPAAAVFSMIVLLLYKKRKLQMMLGRLNYILILAIIVLTFVAVDGATSQMVNGELAQISYQGFYFPVAAIAFNFLANRAIKKDEELVQSLNRMR